MGNILGISDLPATTMVSPFTASVVPEPKCTEIKKVALTQKPDVVVLKNKPAKTLNQQKGNIMRFIQRVGRK